MDRITTLKIPLVLAGLALTPLAGAVQIGALEGSSRLGQPFEGYIPLILSAGEVAGEQSFTIEADAVSLADAYQRRYLDGMTVEVVTQAPGRTYLVVRNPQPLEVPLLSFRLRVDAGALAVVRSFALMPELQLASPGRPAAATPRRPVRDIADARVPAPSAPPPVAARPVEAPTPGNPYAVATGQTLSGIALAVGRELGLPWRDVMQQIYRDNPEAFIGGDINRLMAGVTLMLPVSLSPEVRGAGAGETRVANAVEPTPAPSRPAPGPDRVALASGNIGAREDAAAMPEAPAGVAVPPVTSDAVADDAAEAIVGEALAASPVADEATAGGAEPAPSLSRDLLERDALALVRDLLAEVNTELEQNPDAAADPEIAALLAESAALYAQIRARYETQVAVNAPAPLQAAPEPTDTAGTEDAAAMSDELRREVASVGTGVPAATPKVRVAPLDAPRTAEADPASDSNALIQPGDEAVEASVVGMLLRYLVPLIFTLGAIGGVWGWQRWRRGDAVAVQTGPDGPAGAAPIDKAEAERRAQVAAKAHQRMMSEERGEIVLENPDAEVEEFDTTADLVTVALANIDDSIAHGRYQRAEQDLLAVLRRAPHNIHALMRLLDVYYITENTVEFQAIAERIHNTHRADVPEEEWNRLLRMGKVLCPWHPLFGGPSLVEEKKA